MRMSHDLAQRHAFAARRRDADVADVVHRLAELLLVARHQVEALLADENLADGIAAHCRLDGVLNVGGVDAEAVGLLAIHHDVNVRLTEHAEQAEIGNAGDRPHHGHDLLALLLEVFQVGAEDFDGEFALHAADRFFHVVGDGLGEAPSHAGNFLHFVIHGLDQQFLVAVELRPPLIARLQIDEILGVEEARGIGAVVGAADLRNHLRHFGKAGEDESRLIHHAPPAVGPVLGASVPRAQMEPSSRCGRNSEPITPPNPRYAVSAKTARAEASTTSAPRR